MTLGHMNHSFSTDSMWILSILATLLDHWKSQMNPWIWSNFKNSYMEVLLFCFTRNTMCQLIPWDSRRLLCITNRTDMLILIFIRVKKYIYFQIISAILHLGKLKCWKVNHSLLSFWAEKGNTSSWFLEKQT